MLESVGMCQEASHAYVKYGDIQASIDCCVSLQRWEIASDIAKEQGYEGIDKLISRRVSELIDDNKMFQVTYAPFFLSFVGPENKKTCGEREWIFCRNAVDIWTPQNI